jgi:polyferredoxin
MENSWIENPNSGNML